jgi:hypothetical protein
VFSTLDDLLSTGGRDAIANSVFAGTVTVT